MPLLIRKLVLAFMLATMVGTTSGCVIPVTFECAPPFTC
ncbi:hypothetical protein MycrhN_3588 [Mycolicibacterium rhodesiae NBB3]|uniref:Lipoprotein n=1 Tax=Mycolicibacterium rhodesiae (strain NBB3) TaxID=710685 RepID=G8RTC0_MYCRN|nr:hypothetical protein MycrhN_3588 [Mycolicibacterium rhodesiae NBB3]